MAVSKLPPLPPLPTGTAPSAGALVDRARIERMVRAALGDAPGAPGAGGGGAGRALDSGGGVLLQADRGENLVAPYDPRVLRGMIAATPARIAVGRAGTRYRTNTLLRFRADHAAAKDAVVSEVDPQLVARLGLLEVDTRAESKAHFLQRPDAGRALADAARVTLAEKVPKGQPVMVVYGDGLSAMAINEHLATFHAALARELAARSIRTAGPGVFVRRSRVKVMDEICRLVEAEACIFVCGERPGLGFADSMSAYYIYRPPSGIPTDADREVISNINPRGLEPVKAAAAVADAVARILREKKSGVLLG